MIDATIKGRIIMEGAPEYGAQIGEYMMLEALMPRNCKRLR